MCNLWRFEEATLNLTSPVRWRVSGAKTIRIKREGRERNHFVTNEYNEN